MKDLRVVTAKALLRISRVAPIRGFYPPSMMVLGDELYKATEVEMNGIFVDEFIVADQGRLIVRIPESQIGQPLTSIRAYTPISAQYDSAMIDIGVAAPMKTVSGIDRLVQSWLLIFFSTPGSDIFDPSSGGGARSLIGKTTDAAHQGAAADLALCIDRTKNELLRLQAKTPGVPMDERLMSSSLTSIRFDAETSILYAEVALTSMAGAAAQLSLG